MAPVHQHFLDGILHLLDVRHGPASPRLHELHHLPRQLPGQAGILSAGSRQRLVYCPLYFLRVEGDYRTVPLAYLGNYGFYHARY
jgi:hypothetical protein